MEMLTQCSMKQLANTVPVCSLDNTVSLSCHKCSNSNLI